MHHLHPILHWLLRIRLTLFGMLPHRAMGAQADSLFAFLLSHWDGSLLLPRPWVPHVLWGRESLPLETGYDHFPKGTQRWECTWNSQMMQVKESSSELTTNNEVVLLSLTIINLSVNKPLPSECAASFEFPLWILSSAIFFSLLNLRDLPPSTNGKWRGRKGG